MESFEVVDYDNGDDGIGLRIVEYEFDMSRDDEESSALQDAFRCDKDSVVLKVPLRNGKPINERVALAIGSGTDTRPSGVNRYCGVSVIEDLAEYDELSEDQQRVSETAFRIESAIMALHYLNHQFGLREC